MLSINALKDSQLTVLMPVYNAGCHLREAIDSVLMQTYCNFEFLIINDGSTDESVEIIKSYDDHRIRLLHNDRNLGLVATLNKGLDLVRTRYMARMDADDISRPQRFERQLRAMRKDSNIIACGTACQKFGAQHHSLVFPARHDEIYCGLLFTSTLVHAAVMFDMEMMNREGYRFDPDYVHAEDYELWTRLGVKYRLANLADIHHDYRMHESQVSQVHTSIQTGNSLRIQKTMLRRLGFEPSAEEMALHSTFYMRRNIRSLDYLTAAGSWFDKILAANDQSRHFDRLCLLENLGRTWFYKCYSSSGLGMPVWKLYKSKIYSNSYSTPSVNKFKFNLKSILRIN